MIKCPLCGGEASPYHDPPTEGLPFGESVRIYYGCQKCHNKEPSNSFYFLHLDNGKIYFWNYTDKNHHWKWYPLSSLPKRKGQLIGGRVLQ